MSEHVRSFFFSSRRRHTRCSRDWSSDVCSSDLLAQAQPRGIQQLEHRRVAHQLGRARLALPEQALRGLDRQRLRQRPRDRKSTRLNSSHGYISYAVFCLKKKKKHTPPKISYDDV